METFMVQLLDLAFFPLRQTDSLLLIIPFSVLFFCFSLSLIKRLVYGRF